MFHCKQCSKSFEDHFAIKRHLSTQHFNYFPYICDICNQAGEYHRTGTEGDMDKHIEALHQESDYGITLRKDKKVEDKIKAAIEECRLPTSQRISLDSITNLQMGSNVQNDQSSFGATAIGSGSNSSRVVQDQNNGVKIENIDADDSEILGESVPHKGTRTRMASKGISLDFKSTLRQVYNVLCDETTVGLPAKKRESISPQAIQNQMDREITEHPSADKNEGSHKQQFPQPGSNVLLSKRTQGSLIKRQCHNNRTILATESNLLSNDAPIFTSQVLQSVEELPVTSTSAMTRGKLISITTGVEYLNESQHKSIESVIRKPVQISSKDSVAKLIQRKQSLPINDCNNRTQTVKRSNGKPKKTKSTKKPYKCDRCSFASVKKNLLVIHTRTHTGEKPYKCEQCSYSSAQKGNLENHVRTHTGEKPFKCNQCSYASAQSGHLKEHLRIHTGEKPFKCNYCSYASAWTIDLTIHMRKHSGEKPYKCSECPFAGISSSQLCHHVNTHHSKEME